LKVSDLADASISNINFEVRAGEVLGIAGLMGAGRSEILKTIFGINHKVAGHIELDGTPLNVKKPSDAIAAGIGFVTEDRKSQGLVLGLSVRENATLANLSAYSHGGVINQKQQMAVVQREIDRMHIRTRDAELEVKSLSGGNQQKVVFAKWLGIAPKVLFLDEPTRGVDVGGKAEIYQIINELAQSGVAIVMVSSELPEVLAMSDRILVMHQGHQAGIFAQASAETIMTAATGGLK
ncbi:MAG: ATP-binding cassette domain-containing protein, partial [Deefgea sp.]